jgi:hypothetical protein
MSIQPTKKNPIFSFLIPILIVIFFSLTKVINLVTDYWWFDALGFKEIFLISIKAKLTLFIATALFFFIFVLLNLSISTYFNKRITMPKGVNPLPFRFKFLLASLVALFVGFVSYNSWFNVLQYLNQTPFNLQDPIFFRDVAFYVFSLPFFLFAWKFLMGCLVITTIIVAIDYLQAIFFSLIKKKHDKPQVVDANGIPRNNSQINIAEIFKNIKQYALVHLSVLGSLFFILLAVKHYLTKFSIMYSEAGIVVGAGYTDVVVFVPIVKLLTILAIIVSVLFYVWIFVLSKSSRLKKRHILAYFVVLYLIFFFIAPTVIPGVIQALKVDPNEINLEKPYIENNIEFTKIAYGLDDVEETDFAVEMSLTPEILEENPETISNVRILDWRPLTQTYKQTQEIRLYYDLANIDIDRYTIEGKYTEVMLSPRELNQYQITENAQTWVNLHMVYTHGYGVVVSPVNKVTEQGMPEYLVQDIPSVYAVDEPSLIVETPQIYYGEIDNDFVLVNSLTQEFDYPKGNSNEYISYDGTGGIVLDTFWKKAFMALKFMDIKILLSDDLTTESKIMFTRAIQERIAKITPFLMLDYDPYLVINDGKLYWIQDAYTYTGNFPYSEKYNMINYMRNSVKIVVDAYNGDVTYYLVDTEDPLIATYAKIFPDQFKSFEEFPEGLKEHIRYPENLFEIQAYIYSTYHMNDPTVFYNKEDAWDIPTEVYGTGQQIYVEPYYIIMKLPEEEKEEFVLMTSFTPISKDNMIAWLAARSDGDDYGKLLLYKFPKDKLIYGPLQIEAKFDQDSEISQQLTLWSQQGSSVTRGNLLVIPIDNSILYIEPLYIQAETGQLPELKRVLVSDGEKVVMEQHLSDALEILFGKATTKTTRTEIDADGQEFEVTIDKTSEELIQDAQEYYDEILESMESGDWVEFGENFDNLGNVLNELNN